MSILEKIDKHWIDYGSYRTLFIVLEGVKFDGRGRFGRFRVDVIQTDAYDLVLERIWKVTVGCGKRLFGLRQSLLLVSLA